MRGTEARGRWEAVFSTYRVSGVIKVTTLRAKNSPSLAFLLSPFDLECSWVAVRPGGVGGGGVTQSPPREAGAEPQLWEATEERRDLLEGHIRPWRTNMSFLRGEGRATWPR